MIAVVCPLGTNYDRFRDQLGQSLKRFGYSLNLIHLSRHFKELLGNDADAVELETVPGKIRAGDLIRERFQDPAVLAGLAAREIANRRTEQEPTGDICHLVVQLKRPEEVNRLRTIYGPSFWLVGLLPDPSEQKRFFEKRNLRAEKWIETDGAEANSFGQRTTKTFHLADFFLTDDDSAGCDRFLDLVFGNPFVTPTEDERGMYLAYASSWSSADLSRQVGAAVVDQHDDVIGLGYNEVPAPGGGAYVGGTGSHRDFEDGFDANHRERRRMAAEIAQFLRANPGKAEQILKDTRLGIISEFGRAVHAEMAALLACARSGRSPVGAEMFVTTFPCHNCARHIIAAGIRQVVFVEPYARSKALELHADAVALVQRRQESEISKPGQTKVRFEQFVGVGPRRYADLFSIKLSSGREIEREADGKNAPWSAHAAKPRLYPNISTYIERELIEVEDLNQRIAKNGH